MPRAFFPCNDPVVGASTPRAGADPAGFGGLPFAHGTGRIATRWKMPSTPGMVSIKRSRSVMLPSMKVTLGWSRRCSIFSRRPVARLSMMTTS
mgnify:CR=1 FL=1